MKVDVVAAERLGAICSYAKANPNNVSELNLCDVLCVIKQGNRTAIIAILGKLYAKMEKFSKMTHAEQKKFAKLQTRGHHGKKKKDKHEKEEGGEEDDNQNNDYSDEALLAIIVLESEVYEFDQEAWEGKEYF